ncbi:hypothetical protein [Paraburkholderia sp. WSM4175]|uniref:hypothetical protein n=1 Tax=Paraburkholderia sp. WSM4175 TaxID=2991072 RepID=UPI003D2464A2
MIDGKTRHAVLDAFMLYFPHIINFADKNGDFGATALGLLIAAVRNALLVEQAASVDRTYEMFGVPKTRNPRL